MHMINDIHEQLEQLRTELTYLMEDLDSTIAHAADLTNTEIQRDLTDLYRNIALVYDMIPKL